MRRPRSVLLLAVLGLLLPAAAEARGKGKGRGKGGRGAGACTAAHLNCWATRRCCGNDAGDARGLACFTKAPGVRFAQCRTNGCVGTCNWECRLLRPNDSPHAPAVYGAGAQNTSQAIAAMLAPLAPSRAPPSGRSERLGNVIDSWYFASLGVGPRVASLVAMSCGLETCFARYLSSRMGRVSASASQAEAAKQEAQQHESWGLYSYPTIRTLMPQIRHDLRAAMREYAEQHDPALARQQYEGGASHLVVHYRLGDFVTNRWCVPPDDVAAAAAQLEPRVVEVMDGGTHHLDQVDGFSASPHRANRSRLQQAARMGSDLSGALEAALRRAMPTARIVRHTPVSADADWYRIAHAPLLVTGAGSFATTAAIASHGAHVRTPAAANLNFPDRGTRAAEQLAPNWRTYAYDVRSMQGR